MQKRRVFMWRWSLDKDFNASFLSETAPCWFYQFMQRIILGIHWKKIDGSNKRR